LGDASAAELTWGSIAPSKSPWGAWALKVKEQLETASGGKLKINLLLDAQAGDEQAMVGQTARGRLDMTMVSNTALSLLSQGGRPHVSALPLGQRRTGHLRKPEASHPGSLAAAGRGGRETACLAMEADASKLAKLLGAMDDFDPHFAVVMR